MNTKKYAVIVAALTLASVSTSSFAVVDTTAVMAELDALSGYMQLVGGALIVAAATAIGYKWIKGAIFS